ncbi:MAG TPA: arginine repressor [Thermoanaerobaculia bacterium]|nr:arginine repressor [Thermoanaerobaculia bacterium]
MNIHSHSEGPRRREEILRIVRETAVQSQEELLALLRKRGFSVTQPTLSRDVRELGLAKTPNGYVAPGDLAAPIPFTPRDLREGRLDQLIRDSVLFAETAGNLAVIRTPAATAQPLASAIDAAAIDDAVGTIGGDDTIFVAFREPSAAAAFIRRVQQTAGLHAPRRRTRA